MLLLLKCLMLIFLRYYLYCLLCYLIIFIQSFFACLVEKGSVIRHLCLLLLSVAEIHRSCPQSSFDYSRLFFMALGCDCSWCLPTNLRNSSLLVQECFIDGSCTINRPLGNEWTCRCLVSPQAIIWLDKEFSLISLPCDFSAWETSASVADGRHCSHLLYRMLITGNKAFRKLTFACWPHNGCMGQRRSACVVEFVPTDNFLCRHVGSVFLT